ncbi:MEVALONATE KINASE/GALACTOKINASE [Salix koriyanagi]|uniref:MEVALONATE KINASE/GALACTOKINASE n=1 Tax=Salix koriyanagi TaxID=2511006 RepID=A0A9Q0NUI8_9ROSI|nr:MEVALONATE KINASE/GALACTOKINASE [Salix koriyanagi]
MRIEECEGVSASRKHLVFAYYVTGHGFGHATRVVEVVRNLILAGHDVHVVTGAPDFVFTSEIQSPRLFIRKVLLDCGAVQADALTVDRLHGFFSWDFIYAEYVMAAGNHHRSIVWQIAEDYSHCEFLIRLPGFCPMPAFRDVIDVPLVVLG